MSGAAPERAGLGLSDGDLVLITGAGGGIGRVTALTSAARFRPSCTTCNVSESTLTETSDSIAPRSLKGKAGPRVLAEELGRSDSD